VKLLECLRVPCFLVKDICVLQTQTANCSFAILFILDNSQFGIGLYINKKKDQYKILESLSVLVTITIGNYCELKQTREAFNV